MPKKKNYNNPYNGFSDTATNLLKKIGSDKVTAAYREFTGSATPKKGSFLKTREDLKKSSSVVEKANNNKSVIENFRTNNLVNLENKHGN